MVKFLKIIRMVITLEHLLETTKSTFQLSLNIHKTMYLSRGSLETRDAAPVQIIKINAEALVRQDIFLLRISCLFVCFLSRRPDLVR